MRNPTKFGSPKLNIYNLTYDFSKFAYIAETNALELDLQPLTAGAQESAGPACHWHKAEHQRWPTGVRRRWILHRWHRHHKIPHNLPHAMG